MQRPLAFIGMPSRPFPHTLPPADRWIPASILTTTDHSPRS